MARTLLVTNDFPPTIGGIQSYLRDFLACLDPSEVVVFASTQDRDLAALYDASLAYHVIRWPRRVMLPTPATTRRMQEIIRNHDIDTVWFGAAAPLALMAQAAKAAGASRVIATTHGHEVGWSMLPLARQALGIIGRHADYVTYISNYTYRRLHRAFGCAGGRPTWVHLPSAVDTTTFHPASASERLAGHHLLGTDAAGSSGPAGAPWPAGSPGSTGAAEPGALGAPVIVCISRLVPRKGQDMLIKAMPAVRAAIPQAQLVIVGRGYYEKKLRALAAKYHPATRFFTARDARELNLALAAADVFAMPARTRGAGLDVEGLGIVYLEAQAAGVPVIAGRSGGAPETVTPETGLVVDGTEVDEVARALVFLLTHPQRAVAMGQAGRAHVEASWTWEVMGARLKSLVAGSPERLA